MNVWKKISLLGVKESMPIYWQKSIILYNQLARMMILLIIFASVIMYFYMNLLFVPIAFFLSTHVVALSLYLNYKGRVNISVMIISIFFPLFFLFVSVFSKLNNEGLSLIFYIAPRFGIIISIIIPIVIYGFRDYRKSIWAGSIGILSFIFFDKAHIYFGIDIYKIPYYPKNYIFIILGLAVILVFFSFLIIFLQNVNTYYDKIVVKQKEEIEAQRDNATQQRDEIFTQKEQITASIRYASRIQNAILPSNKFIDSIINDYFIFFKPRDIVSGDFYFFEKKENLLYIIAADCTGHGVPGAFMSMLGITYLNSIINDSSIKISKIQTVSKVIKKIDNLKTKNVDAAYILNNLRKKIKLALGQTGKSIEQKDGMDMALCILNTDTLQMQYAGAHNPLYIAKNNELIEYKADRMPISIHLKEKPFTNHTIQMEKGDVFYIFSDGFVDQFESDTGEKYKSKRFKKLLLSIKDLDINNQKQKLSDEFDLWKGKQDQIDDVLIIGVKI